MNETPEQTPEATPAQEPQPSAPERIFIVSGQEFRVDVAHDIEAVRSHLSGQFPDVATATVKNGARVIDGVSYETVEFVKKAGTKGMDGGELAAILATVPAQWPNLENPERLIERLLTGQLTLGQVADLHLADVIHRAAYGVRTVYGGQVWDRITPLPGAAAADVPLGW